MTPFNLKNGEEQTEKYVSAFDGKEYIQYDYRDMKGRLFSCTARTIERCREMMIESRSKVINQKGE